MYIGILVGPRAFPSLTEATLKTFRNHHTQVHSRTAMQKPVYCFRSRSVQQDCSQLRPNKHPAGRSCEIYELGFSRGKRMEETGVFSL